MPTTALTRSMMTRLVLKMSIHIGISGLDENSDEEGR